MVLGLPWALLSPPMRIAAKSCCENVRMGSTRSMTGLAAGGFNIPSSKGPFITVGSADTSIVTPMTIIHVVKPKNKPIFCVV